MQLEITSINIQNFIRVFLSLVHNWKQLCIRLNTQQRGVISITTNQINYQRMLTDRRAADEVKRHNQATESETFRHNVVSEGFERMELIETNRHNVATERETNRSNVAREKETSRHNIATERETQRHNVAQEDIGWGNIYLGYANLTETQRHNQAYESIQQQSVDETKRHNEAQEILQLSAQGETNRHNTRTELIQEKNAETARIETDAKYSKEYTVNNKLGETFTGTQYELNNMFNWRHTETQDFNSTVQTIIGRNGIARFFTDAKNFITSFLGGGSTSSPTADQVYNYFAGIE